MLFPRRVLVHRHPVELARLSASLPATLEYASQEKRQALAALGKNFGCHTCGTRAPTTYIADHMPPLKTVKLVSTVDGGCQNPFFSTMCSGVAVVQIVEAVSLTFLLCKRVGGFRVWM